MISNSQDFLVIQYGSIDLIINRKRIIGSISFKESGFFANQDGSLINGSIVYDSSKIAVLDFNGYMCDNFFRTKHDKGCVFLVFELSGFNKDGLSLLVKDINKSVKGAINDRIGLLVSSSVLIDHIEIGDFKLLPKVMKSGYTKKGILALRFYSDDIVQYFIDIDRIILKMIFDKDYV